MEIIIVFRLHGRALKDDISEKDKLGGYVQEAISNVILTNTIVN